MKNQDRTRFISEVETDTKNLSFRRPFKAETDGKRRFVRLEISSPVTMKTLKDIFGHFTPDHQTTIIKGTILNISEGGVLVDLSDPINEGDIVVIRFILQGDQAVDNVLGLVKRSEADEDCFLTGIEFINRDRLSDLLSESEIDMLSNELTDFGGRIGDILKRFVRKNPEPVTEA